MDEVDEDGSGQIEFNEFLNVVKNASQKRSRATVTHKLSQLVKLL